MAHATIVRICAKRMLPLEAFFGPLRSKYLLAARKEAIETLRANGLSMAACARLVGRDKSTVYYWLHPEARARKRKTMRARKAWKKTQKQLKYGPRPWNGCRPAAIINTQAVAA